jgi:hypothetical protein
MRRCALDPRERVERGREVGEGEPPVLRRVERPQARRGPVLVELAVGEVALPVAALGGGVGDGRAGHEGAPAPVARGVAPGLGGEAGRRPRCAARDERGDDRPARGRAERRAGGGGAVEQGVQVRERRGGAAERDVRVELRLAHRVRAARVGGPRPEHALQLGAERRVVGRAEVRLGGPREAGDDEGRQLLVALGGELAEAARTKRAGSSRASRTRSQSAPQSMGRSSGSRTAPTCASTQRTLAVSRWTRA